MNTFYGEIASGVAKIVFAVIGIIMTVIVAPWLKNSVIPWMKEKHFYGLVKKFVQAAEKLAETGILEKEQKKEYVENLLNEKGYTLNDETEAYIESAVKELDLAIEAGMAEIFEAFDEDADTYAEDTEAAGEVTE